MSDQPLRGRVVLVTAAGAGMGRAGAVRLATAGAHVYVTDRDEKAAVGTTEAIKDGGGTATTLELDVTDLAAIRSVIVTIVRTTLDEASPDGGTQCLTRTMPRGSGFTDEFRLPTTANHRRAISGSLEAVTPTGPLVAAALWLRLPFRWGHEVLFERRGE